MQKTEPHCAFTPDRSRMPSLSWPLGILAASLTMLTIPFSQFLDVEAPPTTEIQAIDFVLPPPPPPIDQTPPPEDNQHQEPPQPEIPPPRLTLEQLELALTPGIGGNLSTDLSLGNLELSQENLGDMATFEIEDLDQRPQVRSTTQPRLPRDIVRTNQGKILIARIKFVLNEQGNPENPEVIMTSLPGTESALRDMILRWRYDPPTKEGRPVRANYIQPFRLNL
jgi:protein TonB